MAHVRRVAAQHRTSASATFQISTRPWPDRGHVLVSVFPNWWGIARVGCRQCSRIARRGRPSV